MDKVYFFARQHDLRRLTVWLLILTVIGSAGVACLGGATTGLAHFQLVTESGGTVDWPTLQPTVLLGAAFTFGLTLLVVFVRLVLLHFSRNSSRRFFHARDLNDEAKRVTLEPADQQLMNVVDEMALAANTPRPHVFLLEEDHSINSFALARGTRNSIIGVTAGSRDRLSRDELQAMIAHEVAHLTNGDAAINVRLLALIYGFRWFYDLSVRVIGYPMRKVEWPLGFVLGVWLTFIFGVFFVIGLFGVGVARIMQAAIARQREYLADASAIQFTRATKGLLGALQKAGQFPQSKKHGPTHTAAFMMFVSPYRARSWFFRTHPRIEQRVEAAVAMTPGTRLATD
jgi:Zn-dependent protease with chaperone function